MKIKILKMKKNILVTLSFLFIIFITSAKERFVRVMYNSNASYEATIIWDQFSGKFETLYLDTIPISDKSEKQLNLSTSNNSKSMNNCIVRLKNLKADQRYYFKIKDSEGISRNYYFSTVSDKPENPISFIGGGDSRDLRDVRSKANRLVAKLKAHAVLFNGDFIGIDIDNQWIEWFIDWEYTIDSDGRITPMIVTRGNHELTNAVIVNLFDVPNEDLYYNTIFGGTLLNLVSLNSEILKIGSQKAFLRKTLKEHQDFYWQLPQYHRPIRAHVKSKKEMETQYRNFVPLFEKYPNVRLCLENDSHTCKITWPIISSKDADAEEGFKRDDAKGIVYAGEGCWGAPLRAADDCKSWTRDAEGVNQFNWIFISKEKMEVRTVKYENEAMVEPLTEQTRFSIPKNIDLWGPKNGTLVEIFQQKTR